MAMNQAKADGRRSKWNGRWAAGRVSELMFANNGNSTTKKTSDTPNSLAFDANE